MITQLIPNPPFHFPEMLKRPLSRPSKVVAIDKDASAYTTVLRISGKLVPVTVRGFGILDHPQLEVEHPDDLEDEQVQDLIREVRHIFSMDADIPGFYNTLSKDSRWQKLFEPFYGLRPIQDANLFESMVRIIIGQQLNVKFAATLVERLVNLNHEIVTWSHSILPVFPAPEEVANWSYDKLKQQSFSQRKAEYVIDFARLVVNGKVRLDELWSMSNEEVYMKLIPIRGVGRWTVECFLLFGMGRPDVMPAGDIGIQNAVRKLYELPHRPKEDEVRTLAKTWAPYRSYAAYYLWQTLI